MKQTAEEALNSALEAKVELLKTKLDQLIEKKSDLSLREKIRGAEVCELLNINARTLKGLRENRLIGYIQIGRKIYYRQEDIESYLSKMEVYYE